MNSTLAATAAAVAVLTALVGGTVAIEGRYAKAQEVREQLDDLYAKQLKLRILEIDLKASQSPADRALREYLIQELRKAQ